MYSFTSRVRYSEIGEGGLLKVTSLIDYLQDCSTFQSESMGLGVEHARRTGLAWLLSAWEIEVLALPRLGDDIRVSTWATDAKGLRAGRNFTICPADDERGERPLVRAASSWFMFDANAGRPVRPPQEEIEPYLASAERDGDVPLDLPPVPRVLRAEGEGTAAAPVAVTAAHLDTNHHVNNAQYVSLALGALSELEGTDEWTRSGRDNGGPLRWLDVHYSAAAKLGDTIYPHVHAIEGGRVVTLDNEAGKPFAIVRIRA